VPRCQLGNVVSQIGDRQFADIIQSFLHDEVREITLGRMEIIAPRPNVSSDQPMVKVGRNAATNMPDWPMPGNIKNFQGIDLKFVPYILRNSFQQFHSQFQLCGHVHSPFIGKISTEFPLDRCEFVFL
jgi:hypothetical protein